MKQKNGTHYRTIYKIEGGGGLQYFALDQILFEVKCQLNLPPYISVAFDLCSKALKCISESLG